MLIHQASRQTGLTKKAIIYYCEQELLSPTPLDNGYRNFTPPDIDRLQQIAVLRKLGMSVEEIRSVLDDTTRETIKRFSVHLECSLQAQQAKKVILHKLCAGADYAEVRTAVEALDNSLAVAQRLMDAFPCFFGRFLCLHFARFLQDPVVTKRQKAAYRRILIFLDTVTVPEFPESVRQVLADFTPEDELAMAERFSADTVALLQAPEQYLRDRKQTLEQYMEFKKSDAYRNSPAFQLQTHLKALMASSGYHEEFLPAMKELSPSYAAYAQKLEAANLVFLSQYPDAAHQEL